MIDDPAAMPVALDAGLPLIVTSAIVSSPVAGVPPEPETWPLMTTSGVPPAALIATPPEPALKPRRCAASVPAPVFWM